MILVHWMSGAKKITKFTAAAVILFLCLMFVYRLSGCIGEDTSRECAWAIAAVVATWLISSTLYLVFDTSRLSGFIFAFFASSSLRILLACACIVMMLKYGDFRKYVLLIWSGVLYFLLLIFDTYFNVRHLQKRNLARKDFFSDSENEIDISQRQSPRRGCK